MNAQTSSSNRERVVRPISGWVMLPVTILLLLGGTALFIATVVEADQHNAAPNWFLFTGAMLAEIAGVLGCVGFFTLEPNEARVLVLFGKYVGTVRASGFHWGNPFYANGTARAHVAGRGAQPSGAALLASVMARHRSNSRNRISLRARNLNSDKLKVNDKRGNPIEIAAVVVWRVQDTAQAKFDVDDYEHYVAVQSESAVRHLASAYAYDDGGEDEITLRSGMQEVSQALRAELQERLAKAGVAVEEARLTHLAYAPEIAQAMLRRQQAEAVIAARQKIVHGAVSMVEMALKELAEKQVLVLDDERKAAMVSNLMVVLCGEAEVHPVINTGTLYA